MFAGNLFSVWLKLTTCTQVDTEFYPLMHENLTFIGYLNWGLYTPQHQRSEKSIAICLGRQNYASALTAKIYPLCVLSHCIQIRVFKCGCGREGQHLSFLWTYVKHYIVNFGGILLLVKFPSKLIQPIRSSVGAGGAANKTDSGEPLSDPQLGSNNTAYPSPRHYHSTAGLLITIL